MTLAEIYGLLALVLAIIGIGWWLMGKFAGDPPSNWLQDELTEVERERRLQASVLAYTPRPVDQRSDRKAS